MSLSPSEESDKIEPALIVVLAVRDVVLHEVFSCVGSLCVVPWSEVAADSGLVFVTETAVDSDDMVAFVELLMLDVGWISEVAPVAASLATDSDPKLV